MSSTFGTNLRVTIFGESHGPAIGAVIDSPPAGILLDRQYILTQIHRRAPGQDASATPRREQDIPQFLSGILEGKTTGAPITLIIKNNNIHPQDYENLRRFPAPPTPITPQACGTAVFRMFPAGGIFRAG